MNVRKSLERVLEFKKEDAVPYDEQTPEQREQFLTRVKILNSIKILREFLIDNWYHVTLAKPRRRSDNKNMHDRINKATKDLKELIVLSRSLDNFLSWIMIVSDKAKEDVDLYTHNSKNILQTLIMIPDERSELALEALNSIANGSVQAESKEDYIENIRSIILDLTGKEVSNEDVQKSIEKNAKN